jgi:hypothetical protein
MFDFRRAFGVAAIGMLVGCGGAQTQVAGAGAVPLGGAKVATSSGSDLLYTSDGPDDNALYIYTEPGGVYVASSPLPDKAETLGMCSDEKGNVFVTAYADDGGGYIFEYAHGGITPTQTIHESDYYDQPWACSVDPTTGNLAVANYNTRYYATGDIAIFPNASGQPISYTDSEFSNYISITYDGRGDLFVYGDKIHAVPGFAELPSGSGNLTNLSVSGLLKSPWAIQWDGAYLAVLGGRFSGKHSDPLVYRVAFSGSTGTIVGKQTKFKGLLNLAGRAFWIQGNTVLLRLGLTKALGPEVGVYNYPGGGKPTATIPTGDALNFAFTVSVQPTR